jgi:hypothetical protein
MDLANQIITVSQINAANIIQIYETMTLTMTFYAVNATWPAFITFHDFEAIGYQAIKHTGANFVAFIIYRSACGYLRKTGHHRAFSVRLLRIGEPN